jgi:hypothetical protein
MTPVLVSVDKAGDLKLGRKKCRLYKKDEVVKVAKKYGINTEKKTVGELCGAIKARAKNSPMNNVPLAKLYPEAAKKRTAAKKRAEKKALDKKIAANFMRNMTTPIRERIMTPTRKIVVAVMPKPKPRSPSPAAVARARANVKNMIDKRVSYMNAAGQRMINRASPRAVMRIARELRRLR